MFGTPCDALKADACLLLVDAAAWVLVDLWSFAWEMPSRGKEGPMPQTKFVLRLGVPLLEELMLSWCWNPQVTKQKFRLTVVALATPKSTALAPRCWSCFREVYMSGLPCNWRRRSLFVSTRRLFSTRSWFFHGSQAGSKHSASSAKVDKPASRVDWVSWQLTFLGKHDKGLKLIWGLDKKDSTSPMKKASKILETWWVWPENTLTHQWL